jgi:hypothetical protein
LVGTNTQEIEGFQADAISVTLPIAKSVKP